jgi:hypothetical protein
LIYVTVFAQGFGFFELLLSNITISENNIDQVSEIVDKKLDQLFKRIFDENERGLKKEPDAFLIDSIFMNALFLFDRHRHPNSPKAILVLLTDGLVAPPDISKYENMLTLLSKRDVEFSYSFLGKISHFGAVPNLYFFEHAKRRLRFSCNNCFYFQSGFSESSSSYHFLSSNTKLKSQMSLDSQMHLVTSKVKEYALRVSHELLISSRISEGFHNCRLHRFPTSRKRYSISIMLSLEWKPDVFVDYGILIGRSDPGHVSVSLSLTAPYDFLRKFQSKKNHEHHKNQAALEDDLTPSWIQLMQYLQLIVYTDQVMFSFSSIDQMSIFSLNNRITRSSDGSSKLQSEERKKTSRIFGSFLKLPLIMWRTWLDVEKIDFVCRVGRRHDALPYSFAKEDENRKTVKSCLHDALAGWSSYLESGKLFVKGLKKDNISFTEFAIAKITWISDFYGCIYVGFFGVEQSDRRNLIKDLRKKVLWPSIFIESERHYINPFSVSAINISSIAMANYQYETKEKKLIPINFNNKKGQETSRKFSNLQLSRLSKSKRSSNDLEREEFVGETDYELKKQRLGEGRNPASVSEYIKQSFGIEYIFKPSNVIYLNAYMTSFEWKVCVPEESVMFSYSNIFVSLEHVFTSFTLCFRRKSQRQG